MSRACLLAALLLMAGCAETDPYRRAGLWQPTGANALNLAAMVVNPRDLLRGHGERTNDAAEAVPPVSRIWSGRTTALPSGGSQQTSAASASAAPATASQGAN